MKFTLDCAKWRCGRYGNKNARLGTGSTQLLNSDGYACCLGQFSQQLGIDDKKLFMQANPSLIQVSNIFAGLFNGENGSNWDCTRLAREAIVINDDENTPVDEKIQLLQELFAKNGHTIEVINKPETVA